MSQIFYEQYLGNLTQIIRWTACLPPTAHEEAEFIADCNRERTFTAEHSTADVTYNHPGKESMLCAFLKASRGVKALGIHVDEELIVNLLSQKEIQEAIIHTEVPRLYFSTFTQRSGVEIPSKLFTFVKDMPSLKDLELYVRFPNTRDIMPVILCSDLEVFKCDIFIPLKASGVERREEEARLVSIYVSMRKCAEFGLAFYANHDPVRLCAKLLRVYDRRSCRINLDLRGIDERTVPSRGSSVRYVGCAYGAETLRKFIDSRSHYSILATLLKGAQLSHAVMLRVEDFLL